MANLTIEGASLDAKLGEHGEPVLIVNGETVEATVTVELSAQDLALQFLAAEVAGVHLGERLAAERANRYRPVEGPNIRHPRKH